MGWKWFSFSKIKNKFFLALIIITLLSINCSTKNFDYYSFTKNNKIKIKDKEKENTSLQVLDIVDKINNQPLSIYRKPMYINKKQKKEIIQKEIEHWNVYKEENKKFLFIGDSRFVGMKEYVKSDTNIIFLCKSSIGYDWLYNTAQYELYKLKDSSLKVIINLGINDLYNRENYLNLIKKFEKDGIELYFMTLNPCDNKKMREHGYRGITQEEIIDFNYTLEKEFKTIDTFTYLIQNGYYTIDGVHYTKDTYLAIYNYTMHYLTLSEKFPTFISGGLLCFSSSISPC